MASFATLHRCHGDRYAARRRWRPGWRVKFRGVGMATVQALQKYQGPPHRGLSLLSWSMSVQ